MEIVIPKSIKSKEDIIHFYAKTFNFPDYYSINWDSFDECMAESMGSFKETICVSHSKNLDLFAGPYRKVLMDLANEFPVLTVLDDEIFR